MQWQWEYAGLRLYNKRILVCNTCLDDPQPQLKSKILAPDPVPKINARPEAYTIEEAGGFILLENSDPMQLEAGGIVLLESN